MIDEPAPAGERVLPPERIPSAGKPSKRRLIITASVGLVIMVGVFWVLFPQLGNYEQAFAQLDDMPLGWEIALIAAGIFNILVYPFTVLVSVPGLRYWPGFVERQVGFLVSSSIPGGGVFAVGAQYRILATYGASPARSAAAVSADAVWTYLLTLAMPAIAVLLLILVGDGTAGYTTLALIGCTVVVVSIAVIVVVLRTEAGARRVGQLAQRLVGPVFRRLKRPAPDIEQSLIDFRDSAHDLVSKRWIHLTITNFLAQFAPFLVLLCAVGGLGAFPEPVDAVEVFAAFSIALLLVSIPVTPGGLGTVDAALVALLTAFGAPGAVAVAADLLWRLVWFLPQIVAGLAAYVGYTIGQRRGVHRVLPDSF